MGGSHKTTPQVLAVSFVCGICLGLGVAYGGMTDGRKTSSFFNITNLGTQFWDPRYSAIRMWVGGGYIDVIN